VYRYCFLIQNVCTHDLKKNYRKALDCSPEQERECHLQSFDQWDQGQDPLKVIRLFEGNRISAVQNNRSFTT
jgi:hypothetical protein